MSWGLQLGGFRACHVPLSAIALLLNMLLYLLLPFGRCRFMNGAVGRTGCLEFPSRLPLTVLQQVTLHRALGFVPNMLLSIVIREPFNIGFKVDMGVLRIFFLYRAIGEILGMRQPRLDAGLPFTIGFLAFPVTSTRTRPLRRCC